jgi:hypothetical protein
MSSFPFHWETVPGVPVEVIAKVGTTLWRGVLADFAQGGFDRLHFAVHHFGARGGAAETKLMARRCRWVSLAGFFHPETHPA